MGVVTNVEYVLSHMILLMRKLSGDHFTKLWANHKSHLTFGVFAFTRSLQAYFVKWLEPFHNESDFWQINTTPTDFRNGLVGFKVS